MTAINMVPIITNTIIKIFLVFVSSLELSLFYRNHIIKSLKIITISIFYTNITVILVQLSDEDEQEYDLESYAIKVNGGEEYVALSFDMLKLRK